MMSKRKFGFSALLFAVFGLFGATLAFAAGTGPDMFAPPADDKSVSLILAKLFSGLLETGGAGAANGAGDPFISAIVVFNEAVLFIGGILLAYGIIAGTMQTAHDGSLLGKKWSSMWVPIRTSMGVGMIVPIGQGYCVVQYLVMWLVVQGVGIADIMWTNYIANIGNGNSSIAVSKNIPDVDLLAINVLSMLVCEKSHNQWRQNEIDNQTAEESLPGRIQRVAQEQFYSFDLLSGGGHQGEPSYCGKVNLVRIGGFGDANNTVPKSFDLGNDGSAAQSIVTMHATALSAMFSELSPLAESLIKDEPFSNLDGRLSQAVENYKNSVWQGALARAQEGYRDASNYSRDGWLLAGAWYMRLAKISNALNEGIRAVPRPEEPGWKKSGAKGKSGTMRDTNAALQQVSVYEERMRAFVENQAKLGLDGAGSLDNDRSSFSFANQSGSPAFMALMKSLKQINQTSNTSSSSGLSNPNLNNQSPVMIVKSFGDRIIAAAVNVIRIKMGASNSTDAFEGVEPALVNFAAMLGFTMLAFGFSAAYLVPMTPFIIWVACALGWTVMVIEAIIAAPLWAIMHVHPDGEGLTGKGGNGYAMVLAIVLRPALMVFGLIASIAVMYPFGSFINETFSAVFDLSVGSEPSEATAGAQATLTQLAGMFIYVGVMLTLVNKIFSLIHVLPDQILRWIGGGADSFGKGMEQDALAKAQSNMGQLSGAAQSSLMASAWSGKDSHSPKNPSQNAPSSHPSGAAESIQRNAPLMPDMGGLNVKSDSAPPSPSGSVVHIPNPPHWPTAQNNSSQVSDSRKPDVMSDAQTPRDESQVPSGEQLRAVNKRPIDEIKSSFVKGNDTASPRE